MTTLSTVGMLQDALGLDDSDTWEGAARVAGTAVTADGRVVDSIYGPDFQDKSSLEMETSYLMRTGKEPTNDEIMEYLEKHKLQAFMTDVIMHVARHLPLDPFEFLLNHIQAMVMKYHANAQGKTQETESVQPIASPQASPLSPAVTPQQREKVVKAVAMVLEHPELTRASGSRLVRQFSRRDDALGEDDFAKVLKHLEANWGLQEGDTKYMEEILKRWRFRSNAANGTRGLPLWPLSKEDFLTAFPCLLRAIRDKYVPIGSIHRSMFIRQMRGDVRERYEIGARLGRGAYGEVLLIILKETREQRVCKRILQQQEKVPEEEVASEVDLLRALDHPHITRIFEYFEENGFINIVMEPVFGGTLTHIVQGLYLDKEGTHLGVRPASLTEVYLSAVIAQVSSALVYAHEVAGVVHKDLKCDNVLMVGRPKLSAEDMLKEPVHAMLADFGIAEVFSPLLVSTSGSVGSGDIGSAPQMTSSPSVYLGKARGTRVGGTPTYMSPEMFQGSFTEKSDVWSLGVIFFLLMTGELPYKADNLLMQANIVSNPRRHPKWELLSTYQWSLGARRLCQQLLTKDEGVRPTAQQALKSEWVFQNKASQEAKSLDKDEKGALQQQQLQSHMTRMAMHCITSQMNLSQLHALSLKFKKYDHTGDGRLSLEEMRQVLVDSNIGTSDDKDLIVQALDSDQSGKIEYSEFVTGCIDVASLKIREQIPVAFSIFDLDNSGAISLEELRLILMQGANDKPAASMTSSLKRAGTSQATLTPCTLLPDGTTVEKVMKDLDVDKNGMVDCFEFERYLLKEHERIGSMLEASGDS